MKPFWKSKTLWVNVIGLLIAVLQQLGTINWIPQETLVIVLGILNVILRFISNSSLTLTSE